jgi:O-antigen/teichoic acid export membrane protein
MSELPYLAIADPVAKVTFPGFARMRQRGEDVRPAFLSTLRLVALVACPLGVALSAAADPFTRTVLGHAWLPMIGALQVLGLWGAVRPVQVTLAWLLNSTGSAGLLGGISVAALVPLVPALALAANASGIVAVAWVMLADVVITAVVFVLAIRRRLGVAPAQIARALRPVLPGLAVAWAAGRLVAGVGLPAAPELVLSGVASLASYAAAVSIVEPGLIARAIRQVTRRLGRAAEPAGS